MARKEKQSNQDTEHFKSGPWWAGAVEGGLLVWVLAIAAMRATFTETPHVEAMGRATALSNEAISLLMSAALLAAPVVWVIVGALAGRLRWRKTYFTGAVGVFCAAGLVGVWLASDKRAALTDLVVTASGPAAGLLAVQLFNGKGKVRLFLWLLLAVGAAATYACYDKMTIANDQLIGEYEKNPAAFLASLGIEAGSLEHWQYEHRLYSRDVSGFLTTSNSTGSFFLLAVFAGIGLCVEAFGARRGSEETLVALVCTGLATGISLAGLMMTQSKGAVGAFIVFVPVLGVCVVFGKALRAHRRVVCTGLLVLAAGAAVLMTIYGMRHGRLPGGNSMLVRWQYWTASVEMAKEHPVFGTGGGNFATLYMKYKNPAAPETVSDPHNWVLSLLCRFGALGLAAMGAAMVRPVVRMFASGIGSQESDVRKVQVNYGERFFWIAILAGVMAAMLAVRPVMMQLGGPGGSSMEQSAAFLLLVVIPAGAIALVFGLLRFAGASDASLGGPNAKLMTALACGLGAVLLHNLVDFAMFEPGVWTLFWLSAAAGIALAEEQTADGGFQAAAFATRRRRIAAGVIPAAAFAAVVVFAVVPPVRRGAMVYQAIRAMSVEEASGLLDAAVAADILSPDAAVMGARLMMHRFEQRSVVKDAAMMDKAREFAETAIARVPADPRPRRMLGEILMTMARHSEHEAQNRAMKEEAYTKLQEAVRLYPGSDMLNYRLGALAEELGRYDEAVAFLDKALAIETAYRAQFRVMYPKQEEVISRLGPALYADLTARLERLHNQQSNIEEPD